jgi:hypothetical protein
MKTRNFFWGRRWRVCGEQRCGVSAQGTIFNSPGFPPDRVGGPSGLRLVHFHGELLDSGL